MSLLGLAPKFAVYMGDRRVGTFDTHAKAAQAIKDAVTRTGLLASLFTIRQV